MQNLNLLELYCQFVYTDLLDTRITENFLKNFGVINNLVLINDIRFLNWILKWYSRPNYDDRRMANPDRADRTGYFLTEIFIEKLR